MKELFIPTRKNKYKPYLLRKGLLVFYAVILVVVNTFGGLFGISQIAASDINPTTLISLTNQERSAFGLNTLNTNAKLTAAAKAKAENMFEEQYWDHFGPNGETPWQFITGAGYNYVYAGENLAKGFRTSEGVVEAWMASPKHKENIVSENYKDIGIAVKTGVLLGKETTLVVQMFGNLTSEVYGSTSEDSEPSSQTPITQSPVIETGQIKAISITHPKAGDILKDPSILIKGEVDGNIDEYTVELYDSETKIGDVEANSDTWEYSSKEEWQDGQHSVEAGVKGTKVVSDSVSFQVDTSAPVVIRESIQVVREGEKFIVSFDTNEEWYEIKISNGDWEESFLRAEVEDITLENFEPSQEIILSVSDHAGNVTDVDITEYFLEGDSEEYTNLSASFLINSIKSIQGINIVVVVFILILLVIEVLILWRRNKLGKNIGDLFVIVLWITILTVGIFKGFGGITV
jgi:FlaG/FlaF family flagellin (archaellin)